MIVVTLPCTKCGVKVELRVHEADWVKWTGPANERPFVQDLFPYLNADEREMLLSATCKECWDEMFKGE